MSVGGGVATFSTRSAARILAVTPGRIRRWVSKQLIVPSAQQGRGLRFSYRDLALMRFARDLLRSGVHVSTVQRCLATLRETTAARARILIDGNHVLMREGRLLLESDNGQLVLDFRRDDLRRVFDLELARTRSRGANQTAQCTSESVRSKRGPDDADCRLQLAEEMESTGNFDGALHVLVAASEAAPQSAELHTRLGRLYVRLARLDAAEEHFTKALAADSRLSEAHMALADICERSGRLREALRHLSAAHRLIPR